MTSIAPNLGPNLGPKRPARMTRPRLVRSLLAGCGFLALTGVLVALQPGRDPQPRLPDDVTRAVADPITIAAVERPAPLAPTLPGAVAAPMVQQAAPVAIGAASAPGFATDNTDLTAMSAMVLADLGVTPAAPQPMDAATAGILANIRAVTGQAATPASGLQALVVQALREGQTDAYIDALVNEAAGRGAVTVPKALVTNDGRVDTATMLAAIVSQARIAAGETLAPVIAGGEGVEVRVVQKADGVTEQNNFYTVSRGDSLGAIAQRFYGDAARFTAIFEANRAILGSPDRIRVGQRLVIPTI